MEAGCPFDGVPLPSIHSLLRGMPLELRLHAPHDFMSQLQTDLTITLLSYAVYALSHERSQEKTALCATASQFSYK